MLSRNEAFTSQMAQVAAGLLAGSTNSSQTRTLLSALRGIDDPAVKTALLSFATSTPDERLREQAVQNLQNYVADPQVEASLWELARSDPAERVRRRAESCLRQIPMTDLRAADLELRALNPSTGIEERLISLRLLGAGKQDISRIAPSLSQAAMEAPDAETRLKYYRAFDDINDPSFMLPLVQGAQDADAEVRRRAMDALVDYRSEPAIAELLRAMAQSDPDAGVREQAARIFRYEPR
jgi:HEAT repeat protein